MGDLYPFPFVIAAILSPSYGELDISGFSSCLTVTAVYLSPRCLPHVRTADGLILFQADGRAISLRLSDQEMIFEFTLMFVGTSITASCTIKCGQWRIHTVEISNMRLGAIDSALTLPSRERQDHLASRHYPVIPADGKLDRMGRLL